MFIKKLYFLSPKITFYYNGSLSHNSIVSGIISIIVVLCTINISIYYSIDIFKRNTPDSFNYKSFINDAGKFDVNTSSLLHFINIVRKTKAGEINDGIDFTKFNIVGTKVAVDTYLNYENRLERLDHWLYGYCEKKDIDSTELGDLATHKYFENSACIKKFYNSSNGNYYNVGDPGFVSPTIAFGTINELNQIYSIFIKKCNDTTIKKMFGDEYNCKNDSEIDLFLDYREPKIANLYFLNNLVNVLNYTKPKKSFFYRVENPLRKNFLSQNEMNFNPVLIRSHDGLLFDHISEDISYTFDRNDVYINGYEGINTYIGYCFFFEKYKGIL